MAALSNTGGIYHVIVFIVVTEQGAGHFPHGHFLMANQIDSSQTQQLKRRRKKLYNTKRVKSDLSVSTDEGGLQQVASTPRVLALPHQVSGWVVGSTTRCSPDLEKSNSEGLKKEAKGISASYFVLFEVIISVKFLLVLIFL